MPYFQTSAPCKASDPKEKAPASRSINNRAVSEAKLNAAPCQNCLTAWPAGQPQPGTSTLNAPTGTVTANAAIVQGGTDGEISVFAYDDTDLIIDVNGYFAAPGAAGQLSLYPLTPCRVLDTRPHYFNGTITVPVESSGCNVPAAAQVYIVNATVLPQVTLGYLTLWGQGQQPTVSTLNALDGAVTSNMAIVPANSADGTFQAFAYNSTQMLIDIFSFLAPPVTITTTSLPVGSVGQPYQAQLMASGGLPPYSWNIASGNLPPGLALNASSGAITGTPTSSGLFPFTMQVTDSQNNTASAQLSIAISSGVLMITTTQLPSGTQGVGYQATLSAIGGVPPYTWSIASGSLPAGLSLNSSSGLISGTPTAQGESSFIVQVQDSENPPQIATSPTLSISINAAIGNGSLNGIYVLSFTGYNGSNSSPVIMAGVIVADGSGNITAGELDINDGTGETNETCTNGAGSGPTPQTITPGPSSIYSIQPNGLGTMTVVTNLATYNFHIAIRPDGSGTLIQDNSDPNTRGSGVIVPQASGVNIGELFGNFVLGLTGADPSDNRYAAAGQLVVEDADGDVGVSPLDVDDGGTTSQQTFRGTLSTTVDSLGRGCFGNLNFTQQVLPACGSGQPNDAYCYAYYLVSGNQVVLISTDPLGGSNNANLTLWSGLRQSSSGTGFNNHSLVAPTVIELNARDTSGSADVTAGIFVGQGSSSHSCPTTDPATFTFDENQGGSGPGQTAQTATGMYCVSSSTGRVTLSGFSGWSTSPPVMYLGGADPGFVVGTDDAVTAGVVEVQFQTQGGPPPYNDSYVSGGYWGGTFMPAASAVTDSVSEVFADGVGDITATQFTSGPGGPGGPNNLSLTYQVDATGRAVVQQNGNEFGVLYVVSPTKLVLVPSGNNPALSIFVSGQAD